jgi:hypothetical protein
MPIENIIFLALSMLSGLLSGLFLIYTSVGKKNSMSKDARWIYRIVGLLDLYYFVVYAHVFLSVLPFASYAGYIRPAAAIMISSAAFIAGVNRPSKIKLQIKLP